MLPGRCLDAEDAWPPGRGERSAFQQDVARLDVAMDQSLGMGGGQPSRDWLADP
jgi:hypothetical protein